MISNSFGFLQTLSRISYGFLQNKFITQIQPALLQPPQHPNHISNPPESNRTKKNHSLPIKNQATNRETKSHG